MIINSISLNNIRSHASSDVNFLKGINVISGNTGSGKSSILMGIEYALFGKISEGPGEGKLLLRRGSDNGSISIDIRDDNDDYKIIRGLKRVKDAVRNDDSKNQVYKNYAPIDLQNRAADINSYVARLLQIESDSPIKTFEAVTYIKQDELKTLIFDESQQKQEYIDRLLELNRYADTYEKLRDVINVLSHELELEKKEETLISRTDELIRHETSIQTLIASLSDLTDKLSVLGKKEQDYQVSLKNLEIKHKDYAEKKINYERLETQKSEKQTQTHRLNAHIDELEKEIKKIEEKDVKILDDEDGLKKLRKLKAAALEEADKNLKHISEKLHKKELDYTKTHVEKTEKEKEIKALKMEEAVLSKELERLKKLKIEITDSISEDETNGRIYELNKLVKTITDERDTALKTGMCSVCGSEIKQKSHVDKEYGKRIDTYTTLIKGYEKALSNPKIGSKKEIENGMLVADSRYIVLVKTLRDSESKLSSYDLKSLNDELKAAKESYGEAENIFKGLGAETKEIESRLEQIDKIRGDINKIEAAKRGVETTKADLERTYSEFKEIEQKITGLGFKQSELEALEREMKTTEQTLNDTRLRIRSDEKEKELKTVELGEKKKELEQIQIELRRKEDLHEKITKDDGRLRLVSNLREDIRSIREYIRNRFLNDFRSLFQAKFSEIRSDTEYVLDIDNDYNVKVIAGRETLDAKTLSGGEKTSVALAYRMALSSIASLLSGGGKNQLLIMDEPTSGLDKEDINALCDSITRISGIYQIIIVTHEETMKNIADNLLNVTKTSGESIISQ